MSETPREFYVRAVVKRGQLEVVMGLEFDPFWEGGDDASLRVEMKKLANLVIDGLGERTEDSRDVLIGCRVSKAMGEEWPGRRYFLEVQHDDPDEGWVQVITPSGWPPSKPAAAAPLVIDRAEWDRLLSAVCGDLDAQPTPPPAAPERCTCGIWLLHSARARGNGLCGRCTRLAGAAGSPPSAAAAPFKPGKPLPVPGCAAVSADAAAAERVGHGPSAPLDDAERERRLRWRGVETPCLACDGAGRRKYAHGSTWRGGMGVSSSTWDVCSSCWGTGDRLNTGADLRRLLQEEDARVAERAVHALAEAAGAPRRAKSLETVAICAILRDAAEKDERRPRAAHGDHFPAMARALAALIEKADGAR